MAKKALHLWVVQQYDKKGPIGPERSLLAETQEEAVRKFVKENGIKADAVSQNMKIIYAADGTQYTVERFKVKAN